MNKEEYQWHITFAAEGAGPFTLSEMHPDFKSFVEQAKEEMLSASLINFNKFSYPDENTHLDSIIHHITFKKGTFLKNIFRRVEKSILFGTTRVIPSLEFVDEKGCTQYAFAFSDKVCFTQDRRFYRTDS